MLDFFTSIEEFSEMEFDEKLPSVCVWVLQIVQSGTDSEIRSIANHILSIENPVKYMKVVEQLFITDQKMYVKLISEGNQGIAKRRKELAG